MDTRYTSGHNAESRPMESATALGPLPPLDSTSASSLSNTSPFSAKNSKLALLRQNHKKALRAFLSAVGFASSAVTFGDHQVPRLDRQNLTWAQSSSRQQIMRGRSSIFHVYRRGRVVEQIREALSGRVQSPFHTNGGCRGFRVKRYAAAL